MPIYPDEDLFPGSGLYPDPEGDGGLFPDEDLYPEGSLYPGESGDGGLYPGEDVYPGESLYPGEESSEDGELYPGEGVFPGLGLFPGAPEGPTLGGGVGHSWFQIELTSDHVPDSSEPPSIKILVAVAVVPGLEVDVDMADNPKVIVTMTAEMQTGYKVVAASSVNPEVEVDERPHVVAFVSSANPKVTVNE